MPRSLWLTRCQNLAFSYCWVALVEPFSTSLMTASFILTANRFLVVVVVAVVVNVVVNVVVVVYLVVKCIL